MCNLSVLVLYLDNWYQSTVPFSEMYKAIVKKVVNGQHYFTCHKGGLVECTKCVFHR